MYLPVLGTFIAQTSLEAEGNALPILYTVTKIPNLNLLGRSAIATLQISIDKYLFFRSPSSADVKTLLPVSDELYVQLQEACTKLCDDYCDLFIPELGCLKNFELEVQFNSAAKPKFCKPQSVPFAIQSDLIQA